VRAAVPIRVAVLISFPDRLEQFCVTLEKDNPKGVDALRATGLAVVTQSSGLGEAICKIEEYGCDLPGQCFCECPGNPCIYWNYWYIKDGQWVHSPFGASNRGVADGAIEAWVWGNDQRRPPDLTFAQVCDQVAPPPTDTPPPSETPRPSDTPVPGATAQPTPTATQTPVHTATATATQTAAATATATLTPTPTASPTASPTPTSTLTPVGPTATTYVYDPYALGTATITPTRSRTPTPTQTSLSSATPTVSRTATGTASVTATPLATGTEGAYPGPAITDQPIPLAPSPTDDLAAMGGYPGPTPELLVMAPPDASPPSDGEQGMAGAVATKGPASSEDAALARQAVELAPGGAQVVAGPPTPDRVVMLFATASARNAPKPAASPAARQAPVARHDYGVFLLLVLILAVVIVYVTIIRFQQAVARRVDYTRGEEYAGLEHPPRRVEYTRGEDPERQD
jgi:hypothetical protein